MSRMDQISQQTAVSLILRFLLTAATTCPLVAGAVADSEMDDQRYLAKPWYVRDIFIGDVCLYISPVTLVVLLFGAYSLYNAFLDPVFCEASHILVSKGDNPEKILLELKKEIKDDVTKFAAAAAKHSECPSGKSGGMLGSFKRGVMAPPFDRAAFEKNNQVNTTIGPIQTSFGWHLIWIHKRRLE